MKIKAILFDFGGTLDSDGTDWFTRLYKAITGRLGHIETAEFQRNADKAACDICLLEDTSRLSMDGMVHRLCEHIHALMNEKNEYVQNPPCRTCCNGANLQCSQSVEASDSWNIQEVAEEFLAESRKFIERNQLVLRKLQERFRLGCISNNWGNTAGWCRGFGLDQFFETMIDSTVVGAVKPDQRIFQVALDELKLPADACAYVGDRYDCDVLGARDAGLTPVWITNSQNGDNDDLSFRPRRISRLSDLLDIDWE
jgi:putative hydrolase of the HAD superfamily